MIGLIAKDTSAVKASTQTIRTATQTLFESASNAHFSIQLTEQVLLRILDFFMCW